LEREELLSSGVDHACLSSEWRTSITTGKFRIET